MRLISAFLGLLPLIFLAQASFVLESGFGDGSGSGSGSDDERRMCTDDRSVCVKIEGHSGKFTVGTQFDPANDTNRAEISVDQIGEFTALNETTSHVVNDLSNQQFTFSALRSGFYQSVPAILLDMTTNFVRGGQTGAGLALNLAIFNSSGTIVNGPETVTVARGTFKYSLNITNWNWCTAQSSGCNGKVGDHLLVDLKIKAKKPKPAEKDDDDDDDDDDRRRGRRLLDKRDSDGPKRFNKGKRFNFGGGVFMGVSSFVDVDGTIVDTKQFNYPQSSVREDKTIVRVYVPKFTNYAYYDPTVDAGVPGSAASVCVSALSVIMAAFAALLGRRV